MIQLCPFCWFPTKTIIHPCVVYRYSLRYCSLLLQVISKVQLRKIYERQTTACINNFWRPTIIMYVQVFWSHIRLQLNNFTHLYGLPSFLSYNSELLNTFLFYKTTVIEYNQRIRILTKDEKVQPITKKISEMLSQTN